MTLLLRTLTGSRLYGLSHANSDIDLYEVYDYLPTRKRNGVVSKMDGDQDIKRLDLSTFLRFAATGQPQALEAMFAPSPEVESPLMRYYRASYRPNYAMMDTHYHDIINRLDKTNEKHRRHGVRLAMNLATSRQFGRFNPVLTTEQAQTVRQAASDAATWRATMKTLL